MKNWSWDNVLTQEMCRLHPPRVNVIASRVFWVDMINFPAGTISQVDFSGSDASDVSTYEIPIYSRSPAKVALDYGFSALVLPFVVPTVLVLWLLVKLSDIKSPAFFIQTRYGLGGKPFKIVKLRTMLPNADEIKQDLIDLSVDKGPGFKIENDPRVTGLGRALRKTHLDELPQFINVLRGEMSLVGPRANSYSPDHYAPWQLGRLCVLPGVTGPWQVAETKPKEFDERCRMDLEYVKNNSVWGDIKLIFKTASAVAKRSGD